MGRLSELDSIERAGHLPKPKKLTKEELRALTQNLQKLLKKLEERRKEAGL